VALVPSAAASGSGPLGADYIVRDWQTEDGLPQSSVLSMAQTPDGYLWLATFGGLARFDGVRFTVFDGGNLPCLPANRLVRLCVEREGALWILTEYHDVVRVQDGIGRLLAREDGVPEGGFRWMGSDGQGRLWLGGSNAGLWEWREGRVVGVPLPPEFTQRRLRAVVQDADGRPWFGYSEGLFRFIDGHPVSLAGSTGSSHPMAHPACPSRDSGLWVFTTQGLRKWVEGGWRPEMWPCPDTNAVVVAASEDHAGVLWVATYSTGLFRFTRQEGWEQFTTASGLTTPNLRSILCDREGNIWVGTDGGGLLQIKARPWRMITRREGLGIDAVHSVSQDPSGAVWLAGGTGQPYRWDQGRVTPALSAALSDVMGSVWAVLTARDGTVWIGTYAGKLFRYEHGVLTGYGKPEGVCAGSVRALLEDRQGTIWVGGVEGLSRVTRGQAVSFARKDGLSSERVWALAEGKSGELYIGTAGGGLNELREGRFQAYTRQHGLADDQIRSLYMDADGVLWIGTRSGGLNRFQDGRFTGFRVRGGLPARDVGPMVEDDENRLWMVSELGILRVSRRELNEFAAGRRKVVSFMATDRNDGLATIEVGGVQPACLKARDGTLWFGTTRGAACLNPADLADNQHPPPVIIEEARIDDEVVGEYRLAPGVATDATAVPAAHVPASPVSLGGSDAAEGPPRIIVQPHQRRIEFRYTGLSLAAPAKVRFRHRMEGFDPDWVYPGTDREVSYTRLPPGDYRFRVSACNGSGVWNETGASLAVGVLPAFHQTWWFRVLVLAGVAGGVSGVVFLLLHLRVARMNQLARLRGRIASDLHDEIGSNLGGIVLLSDLARQAPAIPPEAQTSLAEIHATAQRTATAMRDIVWFLNPDFDTLTDMVARMREFTRTLLNGRDHAFEFTTAQPATPARLPLEFRRNLFFAFKEILHNIVKHAGARRVHIRIEARNRQLVLRVADDGCGFDPAHAPGGHGLHSLQRRAAEVHGHLVIESQAGRGTTITLEAPLPDRPRSLLESIRAAWATRHHGRGAPGNS
jgi:ligand-binding sensor domain-containing protein/signal transduction histidine kinase